MHARCVTRLDKNKFHSIVVSFKGGELEQYISERGVEVLRIPSRPKILRIPRLVKLLKQRKVDIMHSHISSAGFWGRVAGLLATTPVMIHLHGTNTFAEKKWKRLLVEKSLTPFTDRVICVAESVRQHLMDVGNLEAQKMVVIPNSIEIEKFPFKTKIQFNSPVRILGLGRLEKVKGWDILFKALAMLKAKGIPFQCQLAGAGSQEEFLKDLSQKLDIPVNFLGCVDDVVPLLQDSDILAAPSYWEGLSNALVEAMACGLPIIGTHVGGNVELLQGIMPLIPPGNEVALFEALQSLLEKPFSEVQKIRESGRNRILEKYTMDKAVEEYSNLYLEVAK